MKDQKRSVVGYVEYDVVVKCPSCNKKLYLNKHPYDDNAAAYKDDEEDILGMMLFGGGKEPAQWRNLRIGYTCVHCETKFNLGMLEY